MIYYQKNSKIYYRLEEQSKTYLEIFLETDQCRVMSVTGEAMYTDLQTRLTEHQFEQSDATAFNQALTTALGRLDS